MVHHKPLVEGFAELHGMQIDAGGHIGPEVVVARVDGGVTNAPANRRSSHFQKGSVLVKHGRQFTRQVDVLGGDIEEILKTASVIVEVRQLASAFDVRNQLQLVHGSLEGSRVPLIELIVEEVPTPVHIGIIHSGGFVPATREIVFVQMEGVQDAIVVEEEVASIVICIYMAEQLVGDSQRVVAVAARLGESVVDNGEVLFERGRQIHNIEAVVKELTEAREIRVPEETHGAKQTPVEVDHE